MHVWYSQIKKVSDLHKGPLTYLYLYAFLKNMFFFQDIGIFITRAINNYYEWLHFTESNKLGIITCLPKAGRANQFKEKPGAQLAFLMYNIKITSGY